MPLPSSSALPHDDGVPGARRESRTAVARRQEGLVVRRAPLVRVVLAALHCQCAGKSFHGRPPAFRRAIQLPNQRRPLQGSVVWRAAVVPIIRLAMKEALVMGWDNRKLATAAA